MSDRYVVQIADRFGVVRESEHSTFPPALEQLRAWRTTWPLHAVVMHNVDLCDVDTDGLTEEEREQIHSAGVGSQT